MQYINTNITCGKKLNKSSSYMEIVEYIFYAYRRSTNYTKDGFIVFSKTINGGEDFNKSSKFFFQLSHNNATENAFKIYVWSWV